LHFNPIIPKEWNEYTFRVTFKGNYLEIKVNAEKIEVVSHATKELKLFVYDEKLTLKPGASTTVSIKLKFNE
jgi:maltose phosphorylase